MPLDPSIFQNAGPKPIDIGSLINMARGKQRLDAESSLGGIIGEATNPDGSIDAGKLGRLAPNAGVMAPEMAARAQSYQQGQNAINRQQMENYTARRKIIAQEAFSHISDPDLNGKKLLNSMIGFMTRPEFIDHGYGATSVVNLDQKIRGPNGEYLPASQLRENIGKLYVSTLDPEHAMEMVDYGYRPDGTPDRVPRAMAITDYIRKLNANPNHPNLVPPPHVGQAAPARTAQAAPNAQPGLTVPSVAGGMPTGFEESAKGSGLLFARDLESAANYRREVLPLEQAIPALARLGKTGTGAGTDEFNKVKSFLQSAGAGDLLGIDVNKIKDFDEAKKYLTDWVMSNGSTGTNDKLAAAFASNANVGISNAAAIDVAKSALAVRRMRHAQAVEFAKSGLPEGQYSRWAATWNAKQDPRAFGFDLMTRDAATKFLKSLSTAERKRFDESRDIAERNGLHSPRGGWNAE